MDIKFLGWVAINGDFLAWVFLTVFFSVFGTVLLFSDATGDTLFSDATGDLYFTSNFLTGSTSESGSSGVGAMSGGVGQGAGGKHGLLISLYLTEAESAEIFFEGAEDLLTTSVIEGLLIGGSLESFDDSYFILEVYFGVEGNFEVFGDVLVSGYFISCSTYSFILSVLIVFLDISDNAGSSLAAS